MQKKSYDLVVVGGGIFGLWTAKWAVDKGLSVLLVEKDKIGAGASGGVLGALIPHIPTGWNQKKQFQFEALSELFQLVKLLEEATGYRTGYGRIGRIMPIRKERFIDVAKAQEKAAQDIWNQPSGQFSFEMANDDRFSDWLSPDVAAYGYALDTMAARVEPMAYLQTLRAYLKDRADIIEDSGFEGFEEGVVHLSGEPQPVTAGAIVLAQGYQTFEYLRERYTLDIGSGIKGQAALLDYSVPAHFPAIYDDGVFVVPHEGGTCAVGSTSEKEWENPDEPDLSDTEFLQRAFDLCPNLTAAPVLKRWAGVRPKCHLREPIIGQLFDDQPIFIATGGFKVSFGLAHRVTKALVEEIVEGKRQTFLPTSFTVQSHLEKMS